MKRKFLKLIPIILCLAILTVAYMPVSISASQSFLSLSVSQGGQTNTITEIPKAPPVYGKVSVKLEESGSIIQKGNIRLRFDYFLDPSAPGYDIHNVYVIDETSKEFLAGYLGKLDKEGNPVNPIDYQKWEDSLPHVWRNNPFVCVFVYVPPTITDTELQDKATTILNEAYRYWIIGLDMRGFRTAESVMTVKELTETEKVTYETKLASIKVSKEVFSLAP